MVAPFGLVENLYMPFVLHNAAQTFQRLMDRLFAHLPNVFVYQDEILIATPELDSHLQLSFAKFSPSSTKTISLLILPPEKSSFDQSNATYLGHTISATGLLPINSHITCH
jgi:hypothetical protein